MVRFYIDFLKTYAVVEAIDTAQGERFKKLYNAAEHAKPHEILFRQFPDLFPSEAMRMQLTRANDMPLIPADQQFTVVLELNPESPAVSKREAIPDRAGGRAQ